MVRLGVLTGSADRIGQDGLDDLAPQVETAKIKTESGEMVEIADQSLSDFITTGDLQDLRVEMAGVRTELADTRAEMAGVKSEMAALRAGMAEMKTWIARMVITVVGLVLAIAAIAVAVAEAIP